MEIPSNKEIVQVFEKFNMCILLLSPWNPSERKKREITLYKHQQIFTSTARKARGLVIHGNRSTLKQGPYLWFSSSRKLMALSLLMDRARFIKQTLLDFHFFVFLPKVSDKKKGHVCLGWGDKWVELQLSLGYKLLTEDYQRLNQALNCCKHGTLRSSI